MSFWLKERRRTQAEGSGKRRFLNFSNLATLGILGVGLEFARRRELLFSSAAYFRRENSMVETSKFLHPKRKAMDAGAGAMSPLAQSMAQRLYELAPLDLADDDEPDFGDERLPGIDLTDEPQRGIDLEL
jgi:hypothetical protein